MKKREDKTFQDMIAVIILTTFMVIYEKLSINGFHTLLYFGIASILVAIWRQETKE